MVDSPCCATDEQAVKGPADEAMSELVRASLEIQPFTQVRSTHRIREASELREIAGAGFAPRQIGAALRLPLATVEPWLEPGQQWVLLESSKTKALVWLLMIARSRLEAGYMPSTTQSWWESCLNQLGGERPCTVFHRNPKRVRDSIKPRSATKRISAEPPDAKREGWENLPWMKLQD